MLTCLICGAGHVACGGPSLSTAIDQEVSEMVVSMPRKGTVRTEPREMVRVQLKENDVRSYTRAEAEELIAKTPGAFIVGERTEDEAPTKGRRSAPNKARQPKSEPPASPPAPAETKAEPPAGTPSDAATAGQGA